jgi:hypothetical protein
VTANIAIADSLKALDFNRPNREEPATKPVILKCELFCTDLMLDRCNSIGFGCAPRGSRLLSLLAGQKRPPILPGGRCFSWGLSLAAQALSFAPFTIMTFSRRRKSARCVHQ